MKSAYERALEKLEKQGIDRPRQEAYPPEVRAQMEDIQSKAAARLAELEILHRDGMAGIVDPGERSQSQDEFRAERERIESERDRKLEQLREAQRGSS